MATKKTTGIDAYKDRTTAPIGAIQIDPKTRKPIAPKKKTTTNKRKGK